MPYFKCENVGGGSMDGPRYVTKINGKIQNRDMNLKIDTVRWTSASTLPYEFCYGSAIIYNNEIHILGSYNSSY